MNIKDADRQYIAGTYGRFDVALTHGCGSLLYDDSGKEYIDLGSGIAVNIFGACDEPWKEAVEAQLSQLQHASNYYYTAPQTQLAQLLCERTGMKKVFFGNSGAEANECAIKTARKYSFDKYGEGRHTIVTLQNSFHGRTVTTLAATGQDSFHTVFGPFTEGFVYAEPDNFAHFEQLTVENSCCALMIELIQGEGGVNPLSAEYVKHAAALAAEKDLLLIVDEVQTGNGRTGTLYAYEQYGIVPDLVTTAKGLGGGLPIGVCMMGEKTANVLTPGTHGSTFGGNPVCAAGAVSILTRIDKALLSEVSEKSDYIFSELRGAPGVLSVTGMGLMIGIQSERNAKEVALDCLGQGVLVLTAKDKVRLLPPLNIPYDLLEKAISILKGALAK